MFTWKYFGRKLTCRNRVESGVGIVISHIIVVVAWWDWPRVQNIEMMLLEGNSQEALMSNGSSALLSSS
jgi:hypothetical protein